MRRCPGWAEDGWSGSCVLCLVCSFPVGLDLPTVAGGGVAARAISENHSLRPKCGPGLPSTTLIPLALLFNHPLSSIFS